MLLTACGDDSEMSKPEEPEKEQNKPDEPKEAQQGEMTFTMSGGEATADHPAIATAGHPAVITLSQQSSYQDVDGTTYRCEPQATVSMTTTEATVRVKSMVELTTVKQTSSQRQTGDNPVTCISEQTFTLGGQTIVFNQSYERYSYTTSKGTTIEMPFIFLSAAKSGKATTETRTANMMNAAVTAISLTPLTGTRGHYTTEQAYAVKVMFTVEAETHNAATTAKQTLSFEADYTAIVETGHEYPDPAFTYTYRLDVLGGTNNRVSPFLLRKGSTLALQWSQVAQYSWFDTQELQSKVVTFEPKAMMNLSAAVDTVWIERVEDLDNTSPMQTEVSTSGDNPAVTTGKSVLKLGAQNLNLNWSYEAYGEMGAEGESVKIPYLQLSEPQVVSINKQELADATISGKKAKVYEITVTLSQELSSVNAAEQISETVVYIVKYYAVLEIKLVKVIYRKTWDWVEAHDNMLLASYAKVYRDRTYSNGETFTDMFSNYGHIPSWIRFIDPNALFGQDVTWEDNKISYSYVTESGNRDGTWISTHSTGVPDINKVRFKRVIERGYSDSPPPGTWDAYSFEKQYTNQNISLQGVEIIGAGEPSSRPSGWYLWSHSYDYQIDYYYDDEECPLWEKGYVLRFALSGYFDDEYLVLDGHMFTFLEYRGPFNFDYREEPITMPNGKPAKVITFDVHNTYLGKNFYGAIVDTVYQNK